MQSQLVLLPGWTWKRKRLCELAPRFGCVKAQEIDRLAQFEHRVDQCLARFTNAEREEFFGMRLVEVGRALEQFCAGFTPKRIPVEMGCLPGADHLIDLRGRRFERR